MSSEITIRMATPADANELLQIYAPYAENTAITFEYEVPSLGEFLKRMETILTSYPCLVALEAGRVVGFAYASAFRTRAAYCRAAETTIYIKRDCRGKGVGKLLYHALESVLKRQHVLNLCACIAYSEAEDEYLDHSSILSHEKMGYQKVAHFTKCSYKFGRWYDMIWMEKMLGEHPEEPAPFVPVTGISSYR